jgi:hypothetical protein
MASRNKQGIPTQRRRRKNTTKRSCYLNWTKNLKNINCRVSPNTQGEIITIINANIHFKICQYCYINQVQNKTYIYIYIYKNVGGQFAQYWHPTCELGNKILCVYTLTTLC